MIRPERGALASGFALLASVSGCHREAPPPASVAIRYTVPSPWQGERGVWFYPDARFAGRSTGLAIPWHMPPGQRAADGARLDPAVPEAAVQSLQVPVVLRVTNLANGLSMLLRADDRGPSDPGRLLALDTAAAKRLAITGPTPVAVSIDEARSQAIADALGAIPRASGTAPEQAVAAVPLGPPGSPIVAPGRVSTPPSAGPPDAMIAPADLMAPVPDTVTREPVGPASLMLDVGSFSDGGIARGIAARVGGRAVILGAGQGTEWQVLAGPFATVADADGALDRAIAAGLSGARITVASESGDADPAMPGSGG